MDNALNRKQPRKRDSKIKRNECWKYIKSIRFVVTGEKLSKRFLSTPELLWLLRRKHGCLAAFPPHPQTWNSPYLMRIRSTKTALPPITLPGLDSWVLRCVSPFTHPDKSSFNRSGEGCGGEGGGGQTDSYTFEDVWIDRGLVVWYIIQIIYYRFRWVTGMPLKKYTKVSAWT